MSTLPFTNFPHTLIKFNKFSSYFKKMTIVTVELEIVRSDIIFQWLKTIYACQELWKVGEEVVSN